MGIELKYYSFTDPITDELTKDLGWTITREVKKISIVDYVIKEDVLVPHVTVRIPKEKNVVELSKDEYDKLDTSGESMTYRLRRESHIKGLKKVEQDLLKPHRDAEVLRAELEAKFKDKQPQRFIKIPSKNVGG